mmetsp:Transcript_6528/g.9605  ORF Transcript_6528/g.9605 Transcript_6528/m.9605 type:complete len:652 (-) Transcript_6528:2059-4014(-)
MAGKNQVNLSKSAPTGQKTDGEIPSSEEQRRQSMPSSKFGLTSVFKVRARSTRRLMGSSTDLPPPPMMSRKASKLLGVPPPSQPQAEVPSDRPLEEKYKSRRNSMTRTSVVQMESFRSNKSKLPMGYVQLRNANFNNSFTSVHNVELDETALSSVLLEGLKKPHLCDVAMVGMDGVAVRAPSFLLCSHSRLIEGVLFPDKNASLDPDDNGSDDDHFEDAQDTIIEGGEAYRDADGNLTVNVSFVTQDAIHTALHFLASHEFPLHRVGDSSEKNIRTLTQVHAFATFYKMPILANEVYRTLRVLVNKASHLASAVFDECSKSIKLAGMEDNVKRNELKEYVFDSIREKPEEFLIVGGLKYLSPESIEKIICDQEIDVDEITMFHILFTWIREGPGEREDRLKVAKSLVSNIQLTLMDVKYLNTRVRHSGFVPADAVNDAIEKIEDHLANLSPEEQEHVLVSGAGTEAVNGIYVRMEEDIGLENEEAVFIKEASEDEIGGDYGLYLWRDSWAISPCVDYSNVCYCRHAEDKRGWNRLRPSADNWLVESGLSPAPTCQWNAGADESKGKTKKYEAPRLSTTAASFDMKKINASVTDITDGDHAQVKEFSLDDMLNLPTDQDFESDDYRVMRPQLTRSDKSFHSKSRKSILSTKK